MVVFFEALGSKSAFEIDHSTFDRKIEVGICKVDGLGPEETVLLPDSGAQGGAARFARHYSHGERYPIPVLMQGPLSTL